MTRADAALDPFMLAAYSVTIWVLIPGVMAMSIVAGVSASRKVVLSYWSSSLLVAGATAGWIAWGVGNAEGAWYGVILGAGAMVAGLAAGRPWLSPVRALTVVTIATATAVVLARGVPMLAG